jgi:VIT1/CCC1 family predicted Fe2+/Mn2+ transporter
MDNNLWYQLIYIFTFLVFLLELIFFSSPKLEIVDVLALANLMILTYLLSKIKKKESWIMPYNKVITTLWLMIFLTSIVRTTFWY